MKIPTKTQLILYSLATFTIFSAGVVSHNTLVAARDSFNSLFGSVRATNMVASVPLDPVAAEADDYKKTAEARAMFDNLARGIVQKRHAVQLMNQATEVNAKASHDLDVGSTAYETALKSLNHEAEKYSGK